jgi:hypothetical protein
VISEFLVDREKSHTMSNVARKEASFSWISAGPS